MMKRYTNPFVLTVCIFILPSCREDLPEPVLSRAVEFSEKSTHQIKDLYDDYISYGLFLPEKRSRVYLFEENFWLDGPIDYTFFAFDRQKSDGSFVDVSGVRRSEDGVKKILSEGAQRNEDLCRVFGKGERLYSLSRLFYNFREPDASVPLICNQLLLAGIVLHHLNDSRAVDVITLGLDFSAVPYVEEEYSQPKEWSPREILADSALRIWKRRITLGQFSEHEVGSLPAVLGEISKVLPEERFAELDAVVSLIEREMLRKSK